MKDRKIRKREVTTSSNMLPDKGGLRLWITGDFLRFIFLSVIFLSHEFPQTLLIQSAGLFTAAGDQSSIGAIHCALIDGCCEKITYRWFIPS